MDQRESNDGQVFDDQLTEDKYLEIPSCIGSLTASASQLRQLANHASHYYSNLFLTYGYACDSSWHSKFNYDLSGTSHQTSGRNIGRHGDMEISSTAGSLAALAEDKSTLARLSSICKLLPSLDDFRLFVESCASTIESTIRRITYYLAKPDRVAREAVNDDSFQLTREVRLDSIFVAMMDLMFSLVRLDKILTEHTSIKRDLKLFRNACKLAADSQDDQELPKRDDLNKLEEFIGSIVLTLHADSTADAAETNLFGQTVGSVQNLNLLLMKENTNSGFKRLAHILTDYLVFLAEHLIGTSLQSSDHNKIKSTHVMTTILLNMNMVPTIFMNNSNNRLVGLICLCTLHDSLFKKSDKKVAKALNQIIQRSKSINVIRLGPLRNCHIELDKFLRAQLPKLTIETKTIENLKSESDANSTHLQASVEFERLLMKATPWLINLEREALNFSMGRIEDWPRKQITLIDRGLKLANEISCVIGMIDITQSRKRQLMPKGDMLPFFRLIALLQAIDQAYEQQETFVSTCLLRVHRIVRSSWRRAIARIQKRQISVKYTDRKLDLNSMLLLSTICSRPEMINTDQGRDTQSLCLPMLFSSMIQDELQDLNLCLDLLRLDFRERLSQSTNCSLLFWHLPSFSSYYNHIFEKFPSVIDEIHYIHRGLDQVTSLFDISHRPPISIVNTDWILEKTCRFLDGIISDLLEQFKSDFAARICQEFEVELRLQTHRDLYNEEHNNPFRRHLYNFKQIIKQGKHYMRFRIFNHCVDLNALIEQHLNRVCYDLTSIAPHDWFTYDSMMNLARLKYNLSLVDTQLPAQTLDSGLDLMDITRNLSLFASRYSYDLTNQLFIEKCSNRSSIGSSRGAGSMLSSYAASSSSSQSLNVIQIKHVAQSIQTHGYGLLDSTINCTYQTLKRLINLFSRQVADDKLRATLQKEHQRFVLESAKPQSRCTMSYEAANRIAKQFKLTAATLNETSNSGKTMGIDLDSIRQTVTQLGNLLAFVRLIKSGSLNCVTKCVDYLPELDDLCNVRLNKCAENEFADFGLKSAVVNAANNFDQCLSDFQDNFSSKTDYLKIIVTLFTTLLANKQTPRDAQQDGKEADTSEVKAEQTEDRLENPDQAQTVGSSVSGPRPSKQDHLKLFFLLVPPLMISYIDYLINCKERVTSRSSGARFGALLSDDGFAMGVAFLITVLGQTGDHTKLDWLSQTCLKLREDTGVLVERSKDSRYEDSLKQTSSMTIRRLNCLLSEYVGLEHTLNCALLLFSSMSE